MIRILLIFQCILILAALQHRAAADQIGAKKEIEEALARTFATTDSTLRKTAFQALNLGVPSDEITTLLIATSRADRSSEEAQSFLERLIDVQKEGLPTDVITNSILEGIARNIGKDAILSTVEAQEKRLSFCRHAAVPFQSRGKTGKKRNRLLIKTIYNTMNAGFTDVQINTVAITLKHSGKNALFFINILRVMMELRYFRIDTQQITKLLQESIKQEFSISDIQVYPKIADREIRKGIPGEDVIEGLLQETERGSLTPKRSPERGEGSKTGSSGGGSSTGTTGGSGGKRSTSKGGVIRTRNLRLPSSYTRQFRQGNLSVK